MLKSRVLYPESFCVFPMSLSSQYEGRGQSPDNIAHRALKALVDPVSVTSAGNSLPDWSIRGQ
jgi:hypothetical protein